MASRRPVLDSHSVQLHTSQQVADSSNGGFRPSCSGRHSERTTMADSRRMPHAAGTLEPLEQKGLLYTSHSVFLGPRGPGMDQLSSQRLDRHGKLLPSLTLPGRVQRSGWVRPAFCGSRAGWGQPTGKEERSHAAPRRLGGAPLSSPHLCLPHEDVTCPQQAAG